MHLLRLPREAFLVRTGEENALFFCWRMTLRKVWSLLRQPNNNFSNVKCMVVFGNTNVMFPNDLLVMSQNDRMTGQHVQPFNC